MDYLLLLGAVAPVFLLIGAGYLIRRVGWLTAEADTSLLRLVVNFLYPCLILHKTLGNTALQSTGNLLLAPAVGFVTVVAGYFLSFAAAPIFGIRDPRQRRTFAFTTGIYNYGYMALPLVMKLFDEGGAEPRNAGVLFVHNIGVEAALWTVGLVILTGGNLGGGWKRIFNVPFLAIVTALSLNFTGARNWMPGAALEAIEIAGAAAIPLGLVLTGAIFSDLARSAMERGEGNVAVGACTLRLVVLPAGFILCARFLPAPVELRHVILVQAAMPCAVIPVILARHFGGDPATAFRIVLSTTAGSFLTIPIWLRVGTWWMG